MLECLMMNPHSSINNLLLRPLNISFPFHNQSPLLLPHKFNYRFHYVKYCDYYRVRSQSMKTANEVVDKPEYKPGVFDHLLLTLFRNKMVEEVGWDSDKPGYDGLIEVANQLMTKAPNNAETAEASVRILRSLFPPFLLELFKMLVAPLGRGKLAAIMVARVTALSCQWLMGTCKVNSVDLSDGSTWKTGVLVEKCKYLEESKCVGICINTCKLPTQTFINDYMGVPLAMEPDFSDYSCQFKFGVLPPINAEDKTLSEPCLAICPTASRRRELKTANEMQCPKL